MHCFNRINLYEKIMKYPELYQETLVLGILKILTKKNLSYWEKIIEISTEFAAMEICVQEDERILNQILNDCKKGV